MIRLSEQSPLGTGRHRKCYAHPEDAQRCIKIVYHRGDGGDKEIRRELKYYAHLGRRLKDWSGIPRYHGTVETDCGTGYVYDVIADFDGKPSITLTEFAEQCRYEEDIAQLRQILKQLKQAVLPQGYALVFPQQDQSLLLEHPPHRGVDILKVVVKMLPGHAAGLHDLRDGNFIQRLLCHQSFQCGADLPLGRLAGFVCSLSHPNDHRPFLEFLILF